MNLISKPSFNLTGFVRLPGDKSISHRALMLLPLCNGDISTIYNFSFSQDCVRTLRSMRMLGSEIYIKNNNVIIKGKGKKFSNTPISSLYLGNSGTSLRLISGILSSIKSTFVLFGDDSLNIRPMSRIIEPLNSMGAEIHSLYNNSNPPLIIHGNELKGIDYTMKTASAQVKSSILLASLFANGVTSIHEPMKSRDHTERMLKTLGCDITNNDNNISLDCNQSLYTSDIYIPGDISSAAFIIAAALLTKGSDIVIKDVCFNPTRVGFIEVILKMGANIEILNKKIINNEDFADIRVKYSHLQGIKISGDIIPSLIDEIPVISVLAAFSEGTTIIENAQELKFKESNRIKSISYNLRELGTIVHEKEDGLIIEGFSHRSNHSVIFNSFNDHRIAMAFSIIGLIRNPVKVTECDNIYTSFPTFANVLNSLGADIYFC